MEEFFSFDERSNVWIKIFKIYTVIMFCLFLLAGFILCFIGWSGGIYITEFPFLDGIILLACGCFLAFTQAVVNMLIIQLLNNIQIIRDKVDKM